MVEKFHPLKFWAQQLGSAECVDAWIKALRKEVAAGRLACIRTSPGCSAKILVSKSAIETWLDKYASKRTLVPAPRDA